MCGYCVESIILEGLLETRRNPQSTIDWLLPNYVQEVDDLIGIINKIKSSGYLEDSLDIIFCRLLDHFITHGHDALLYNIVESALGPTLIHDFFTKKDGCPEHNFSEELLNIIADPNIYKDETSWNEFIQNNLPIAGCR